MRPFLSLILILKHIHFIRLNIYSTFNQNLLYSSNPSVTFISRDVFTEKYFLFSIIETQFMVKTYNIHIPSTLVVFYERSSTIYNLL